MFTTATFTDKSIFDFISVVSIMVLLMSYYHFRDLFITLKNFLEKI